MNHKSKEVKQIKKKAATELFGCCRMGIYYT